MVLNEKYTLFFSDAADNELSRLDNSVRLRIVTWLIKNVDGCTDPRQHGKGLTANLSGYWRYRIGDYRVICEIHDDVCEVIAVTDGHRSKIYA
jgi:mRNA interferase RelE/StbE